MTMTIADSRTWHLVAASPGGGGDILAVCDVPGCDWSHFAVFTRGMKPGDAAAEANRYGARHARTHAMLPDPAVAQPLTGTTHPETSRQSGRRVRPAAASQRARTLDALAAAPDGLTAAQLADQVGITRNQMGARLLELRDQGWVEYALDEVGKPRRRDTGGGHTGQVQRLSPRGREQWSLGGLPS